MNIQEEMVAMKETINRQNERIKVLELLSNNAKDNYRALFEVVWRLLKAVSKFQSKQV